MVVNLDPNGLQYPFVVRRPCLEILPPPCNVPGPCGAFLQSNAFRACDRLFDRYNHLHNYNQDLFLPGSKKRSSRFAADFFFGAGVSVLAI